MHLNMHDACGNKNHSCQLHQKANSSWRVETPNVIDIVLGTCVLSFNIGLESSSLSEF